MKKIYIIMDKLQKGQAGGLVATYVSLVELLKDTYNFEIVSISNSGSEIDDRFPGIHIKNVSSFDIYPSLGKMKEQFRKKHILLGLANVIKLFLYFLYIPVSRLKLKYYFEDDSIIIASCPAAAMFLPAKCKFILEVHANYDFFWKGNILQRLQIKLMQKPILTLFRTKSEMNKAKKVMNAGYVYNFYDDHQTSDILEIDEEIRQHSIIYMGRLVEEKNPFMLIECAKKLQKKYPDFKLDIYGTGPLYERMQEEIQKFHLEENVNLKGFTENKTVYKNYSVEWLTSKFEGFGLVIIEAKACGVPTISTEWGDAVKEVISDKQDGYIVNSSDEFVDKTIGLWENETLLKEMSKQAQINFKKFGPAKAKEKWIRILEDYSNKYLTSK